ncbi:MAG: ClbS/DfsB family four-helix bundle protein [Chloroflexota bacterium]
MATTIDNKKQGLELLGDIFHRWEALLVSMSEGQITNPQLPSALSIKDEVAHLWAWQQRSVARIEAFLNHSEPQYPKWPQTLVPDSEDENVDQLNAWIYETNRNKSWPNVHEDWREQFQRLLQLVEEVPQEDLVAPGAHTWMEGYPLSATIEGTYEHHEEHLNELTGRLRENGGKTG